MHGLESGDQVTFREVVGMNAINGTTHTIKGETRMCSGVFGLYASSYKCAKCICDSYI